MVSKAKDTVQCCDTISIHIVKKLSSDHHHHQSCPKLSTVRRNLFGIHDDESKRDYGQFLNEQLSDLASKSSQEWNFDFVKELPQPGKYVWQRVQGYEVPVWYAAVSRPSMKEASQVSEDERESTNRNSFHFANSKTSFIFTKEKAIGMEQPSKKPRLVQTTMKGIFLFIDLKSNSILYIMF